MAVGSSDVESWLGSNPEWTSDYFLRKADLLLINKWLLRHGFGTLHEYVNGKDSASLSGPVSPDIRTNGNFNFQRSDSAYNPQRTNSKKHLRHDFARSKTRSIFRTHEATTLGATEKETTLAERRSSLKGMRQFLSLPPTSGIMLSRLIQSKVHLPSYSGKNIDLKRELHAINERDFFFEIVKDISHDLDPKSLTNRILVNVCILLDADRSSLFFVEGDKERRSLVSKVFDIYTGTDCIPTRSGDNIVRIPWGQGILGHVAESGETVNITEASQDPRYKDDLDRMVGYSTDSLLSMPIRSADGDIIGVVQVTNKNTVEGFFTKDDEKVLETYLAFCGMAISTAQAIEAYSREYDRNKALLEVVHDLFEEQTSVDHVVTTIMQRAQSLLKCERCVVMLKEDHCNTSHEPSSFNRLFDIQNSLRNGQKNNGSRNGTSSLSPPSQIAEIVAKTGETVNISDGHTDQVFMFPDGQSSGTNLHTKSLLCKPIRNNKLHTIGVAQLINRLDGKPFDHYDDELFEVFAIFCGLGINNCLLYDQVSRSAAKQAVALEVLSYHAHIPKKDVVTFMTMTPPNLAAWRLDRLDFNDYLLNTDEMVLAAIHMFEEAHLLKTFKIEYETLVQWLLTLRKNYRSIAYHNWRHAFNVGQFMFALLETCGLKCHLTDLECLALIVACLCHDLDHRGTNNAFQLKSGSPLMQLYGTEATLEHHHFNHAVMILNSEGHNIFGNLSSAEYTTVMPLLKHAILATDIPLHMQMRNKFFALVEDGNCDWSKPESRTLLRSILMTTCDIATITKPWEVQRKAASLVVAEFFNQGDQERSMFNIQPQEQMDREREDQLPKLQMKWIDGVCLPLYTKLTQFDRQLRPLVANVLDNRENWRKLDEGEVEKSRFKETGV